MSTTKLLYEAKGGDGHVAVYEDAIVLTQRGLLSRINKGLTGEVRLQIADIVGVQIKKPGFTSGYIQFQTPGHVNPQRGVSGAVKDELSITLYGKDDYERMVHVRDLIEDLKQKQAASQAVRPAPHSVAEELEKLISLKERGYISDEEFQTQRSRILQ